MDRRHESFLKLEGWFERLVMAVLTPIWGLVKIVFWLLVIAVAVYWLWSWLAATWDGLKWWADCVAYRDCVR